MNFNNDNSLQSAATTLSTAGNFINVVYSNVLNSYQTSLIPSTILYGIGSNLSLVNYNNLSNLPSYSLTGANNGYLSNMNGIITLNMPTNYSSSMTISNLISPTSFIYQGNELSSNYLQLSGGTMTGQLNLNYSSYGVSPVPGILGGDGTRIVLNPGLLSSDYCASIGVGTNIYWFSAPNNAYYYWYINGANVMNLSSTGVLSAVRFREAGVYLSLKYLDINSNAIGASNLVNNPSINVSNINASNLILTSSNNDIISLTNYSPYSNVNINFINDNKSNAIIGVGGSTTMALNSSYSNNFFIHSQSNIILNAGANSTSNPNLFISTKGNIGIGTSTNLTSNLNINGSLSVSNITSVGSINASILQELGTNISSKYLSQTTATLNYLTSNFLYLPDFNNVKQYPPKAYDSFINETTTTFLNKTVYYQTITINPYLDGYGIGIYKIYSSSFNLSTRSKALLFNYDVISETTSSTHWGTYQYTSSTGIYNSINNSSHIKSDYLGDWIIIQLPNPIILTKFRFYPRTGLIIRAPGEWKCYGSLDGITFNEIIEGSEMTRLTTDNYSSGYYEKQLASTFTTAYSYIGWTINKLAGIDAILNFVELQIFGTNYIKNYLSLNDTQTFSGILSNTGTITSTGTLNATSFIYKGSELSSSYLNINSNPSFSSNLIGNPSIYVSDITSYGSISGIGSNLSLINYNNLSNLPSYSLTGANNGYLSNMNGIITLNMPTNYSSSMTISNLISPTSFIYQGSELSNYLNTSSTSLNSSNLVGNPSINVSNITATGTITGNFSGSINTALNSSNLVGNPSINVSNITSTGTITGFTTLNGTSGIFGTIAITNNINKAAPSTGISGGSGDKIILSNGSASTYPYSLGVETSALWISSHNDINFYNGGVKTLRINNNTITSYTTDTWQNSFNINNNSGNAYGLNVGCSGNTTGIGTNGCGFYDGNGNRGYVFIMKAGNVGIGSGSPTNILQVGNAGRLRIANDTTDYSLIGTADTDGTTNTRIVISGNTRASPYTGNIEYVATTGSHIFYTTTSTTERMRILNNGNVGIATATANTKLEVYGAIYTSSTSVAAPVSGSWGGSGDRIIFYKGSTGVYPYSIGIDASTLWLSSPTYIKLYNNGFNSILINTNGNTDINGVLAVKSNSNSADPNLQMGNTNGNNLGLATFAGSFSTSAIIGDLVLRSSNRLLLQSGIGAAALIIDTTNNITATATINATTLQEGGTSLTSKYLQLSGGTMTGNINLFSPNANSFIIKNTTASSYASMQFTNSANANAFIGIAGASIGGNYVNNLYLEANNAMVFNTGGNQTSSTPRMIILSNGNIGVGTTTTSSTFHLNSTSAATDIKIQLTDGTTGATNVDGCAIIKTGATQDMWIQNYENANLQLSTVGSNIIFSNLNSEKMRINYLGNLGIGTNSPNCKLDIRGIANITNTTPYGVAYMQNGSLTIGDTLLDYGNNFYTGGSWVGTNTAGLLMECSNSTEMVIHDYQNRLVSVFQYLGGISTSNLIIGRDMGWGTIGNITLNGKVGINSDLIVNNRISIGNSFQSSATLLTISGTSSGNTQPLVQITQNGSWNGNYALQVSGYTNLGGIRINGADYGNTIYSTLANTDIGIAQFPTNSTGGNINLTTFGAAGNINFNTNGANIRMTILPNGNVGIGTTATVSNSLLQLHSTTQTQPRLILSGKEFYNGVANSSNGIAFLLGTNSDNSNRQLWIADSSLLTINTTNPIFRINLINNYVYLDSVATNGTTQLPITFGNTSAQSILAGSTIYLNGNVGIGTSTSITSPLTVNGNIYSSGDIQGATATVNGVLKIAANNWITSSDNMLRIYFANNSDTLFQCTANYSFRKTSDGSSLFYIAQTGNIGIGTATNLTSYLLNVNGSIGTLNNSIYTGTGTYYGGSLNLTNTNNDIISLTNSSASSNTNIKFINSSSINSYIGLGGTSSTTLNSSYQNNLFLHSTCNIILNANNNNSSSTPHLFISNSGNVGIGTSVFSTLNFAVYGNTGIGHIGPSGLTQANIDSNCYSLSTIYNAYSGDANFYSYWGVSVNLNNGGQNPSGASNTRIAGTSSFTINQKANGGNATSGFTNLFTVLQNGNVGIGLTNPTCALTFNNTVNYKLLSLYDNNLTNIYQFVGLGANNGLCFNNYATGDAFQFRVGASTSSATEVMRITGGGIVGIGTNNPVSTVKLDCRGEIYTSGLNVVDSATLPGNAPLTSQNYQLSISPPSAGNPAKIQTIQQSVGFNQNLIIQGQANSGNVGIGTTPSYKLDVLNNINISGSVPNPQSLTFRGTNYNLGIAGVNGQYSTDAAVNDMTLRTDTGTKLFFQSGVNASAMMIDTNNNISINSSTNPSSYKLNVNGTIATSNNNIYAGTGTIYASTFSGTATNASNLVGTPSINVSNITSYGLTTLNSNLIINPNNFIYTDATYLTNITFEYQNSNYSFPPTNNFTTASQTFNNQSFGNGTYTISASTSSNNSNPYLVCDGVNNSLTNSWFSSNSYASNNIIPANYIGSSNTIIKNTGLNNYSISGEWIQLFYNKGFCARQLTLNGIINNSNSFPYNISLVSSFDNSNWQLLSKQSNIILNSSGSNTITFNNNTAYDYYRVIINNTSNSSNVIISEMNFQGTQNSTYINADNFNSLLYNTDVIKFPSTSNFTSTSETTSLNNEIYCVPSQPYKQTITMSNKNNDLYTIYSSSTTGTNVKSNLFNSNSSDNAYWSNANYSTTAPYACTQLYSLGLPSSSSYSIKGDWVVIKFPFQIILNYFNIIISNTNNAPGLWNCYGSDDGIIYNEITDASQTIQLTSASYVSNTYTKILLNKTKPYLYLGWVFTNLTGTGAFLSISELQIFGYDNLSSVLSRIKIDGSGNVFFNGFGGTLSDMRYKKNINRIESKDALTIINKLDSITYNLIDDNSFSSGLIAQDVREILPFLVNEIDRDTNKTKQLTLNYLGIIPYLIESTKELNKIINEKNVIIENLQDQINDIKKKIYI